MFKCGNCEYISHLNDVKDLSPVCGGIPTTWTLCEDFENPIDKMGEGKFEIPENLTSPREDLLNEALDCVMRSRNNTYGPPTQDFDRIAAIWNIIFESLLKENSEGFKNHHVAMALIAMKMSRLTWNPSHKDSWVDVAGYSACGFECADAQAKADEIVTKLIKTMREPSQNTPTITVPIDMLNEIKYIEFNHTPDHIPNHLQHWQTCNCLSDTSICCDPKCPCKNDNEKC